MTPKRPHYTSHAAMAGARDHLLAMVLSNVNGAVA